MDEKSGIRFITLTTDKIFTICRFIHSRSKKDETKRYKRQGYSVQFLLKNAGGGSRTHHESLRSLGGRASPFLISSPQKENMGKYFSHTLWPHSGSSINRIVPEEGVEPSWGCPHRILSPARLPFHHSGCFLKILISQWIVLSTPYPVNRELTYLYIILMGQRGVFGMYNNSWLRCALW